MKRLSLAATALLAVALGACHSQRQVTQEQAVTVDSLARSASHRTTLRLDSLVLSQSFAFDTLTISVERQVADTTEIVRLKAVKGQVLSHRKQHMLDREAHQRLDTVAFRVASHTAEAEHTASTSVYDPPNTTGLLLLAILLLGALAYFLIRKKL